MKYFLRALFIAGTVTMAASAMTAHHSSAATTQPTIVLVHGAFADASSWNSVIASLQKKDIRSLRLPIHYGA
jgi:pimeloyl-ACP methyl ester carboxylesterase